MHFIISISRLFHDNNHAGCIKYTAFIRRCIRFHENNGDKRVRTMYDNE